LVLAPASEASRFPKWRVSWKWKPLGRPASRHVFPLLRRQHDAPVQTALYEAAAEQAYLIGWMAYDDGQHGLALRYLIQALRLSQEGESPALGAHVLAGLSDQANLLGYPKEALALARTGRRGMEQNPGQSTACVADLWILEARALACLGEAKRAATAVAEAERVFGQVVAANEPEWARFIDHAYLFGEAAHCFRDLAQPEQIDRFAAESVQARPNPTPSPPRSPQRSRPGHQRHHPRGSRRCRQTC
jgi:tetratricopeptide (TPR) repeat protein